MILSVFFLSNFFIFVESNGYICPGNVLRNPPLDLNEAYYFPETWNDSQEPPVYNASQFCNWQINVPDGMYATVFFHKYTKDRAVHCTYPNQKTDFILDNDTSPYIFTSEQFQIDLQAKENEGRFAFKVIWYNYPAQICENPIELSSSNLIPSAATECTTTFTAPQRVLLVGFALADILLKNLRLSALYEGDSVNGKYLGNLLDAYNDNIKSEGKQLTVYTFGLLNQSNHTLFLGMDVQAAGNINHFTGLDCSDYTAHVCFIRLSSLNGATAVITASDHVDYLKLPTAVPTNANLKIYEGQIDDNHLLTTVNKTNLINVFPMAVKNTVKIYSLDTGSENIQVFRTSDDAYYSQVYVGRYVNIHSFYVGQLVYHQDTFENFTTGFSNSLINFNFNVKYFEVNGASTTLEITVYRAGNVVFYEKYFGGNWPPTNTFKVLGDSMTANYQTFGVYTNGFIVELLCTANDEASTITPPATLPTSASPVKTTSTLATVPGGAITTTRSFSPTQSTAVPSKYTTVAHESTTNGAPVHILSIYFLIIGIISFSC